MPFPATITIENKTSKFLQVGNRILSARESEPITFTNLSQMQYAQDLALKGNIIFMDAIPQDILDLLNTAGGPVVNPTPFPVTPPVAVIPQTDWNSVKSQVGQFVTSVQTVGIAEEPFTSSASMTKTFSKPMSGLVLFNSGTADLTFTIAGQTYKVKKTEKFSDNFAAFTQVNITATSSFYAYGRSGVVFGAFAKDAISGTGNATKVFTVPMNALLLKNDYTNDLIISVNGYDFTVHAGETFDETLSPFTSLAITATGAYHGYVRNYVSDVTPPVVSIQPAAGSYTSVVFVSLTANEPATIYYSLDGSDPTTGGLIYTGAFNLNKSATVKYFGVDAAGNKSAVQFVDYTINIPVVDVTPPVVTASPATGTYIAPLSVALTSTESAAIYYSLDGNAPNTSSVPYSGPFTLNATTTVKFIGIDSAGNTSDVKTVVYTLT
jgi:hypothetical protein